MTTTVLDRPAVALTAEPTDTLIVTVTQSDIDLGNQGLTGWCAIALAAQRLRSGGQWSMSTCGELSYLPKDGRREYWYSDEAGDFAADFDHNRGWVHPERFVFRRTVATGRIGQ